MLRFAGRGLVSWCCGLLLVLASGAASAQIIDTETRPVNIALNGTANTNGELYSAGWSADMLIDGVLNVIHGDGPGGVLGEPELPGFNYTIDLGATFALEQINILPRQDDCCPDRLRDFHVSVHADDGGMLGDEVWGLDLYPDEDSPGGLGFYIPLVATDAGGIFEGRYIQITTNQDPVDEYELQLAEVEVFTGETEEVPINYALGAEAFTNGTLYIGSIVGTPQNLTDGSLGTIVHGDGPGGTTGITEDEGFFYEINLGQQIELAEINIWPRQDGCCPERLTYYEVSVHEDNNGQSGDAVWSAVFRDDYSYPDPGPTDPELITADFDPTGVFTGQWIRITSLDEDLPDYRLQLAEVEVFGHANTGVMGDYNNDGQLNELDLNLQAAAIAGGQHPQEYDLNDDDLVDYKDRELWVNELKNTWIGDANLSGEFNSGDMVQVFSRGKYEKQETAGWEDGDWNGDTLFGSGDMVAAFVAGGYEKGLKPGGPNPAVSAIPEPSSVALGLLGLIGLLSFGRRR